MTKTLLDEFVDTLHKARRQAAVLLETFELVSTPAAAATLDQAAFHLKHTIVSAEVLRDSLDTMVEQRDYRQDVMSVEREIRSLLTQMGGTQPQKAIQIYQKIYGGRPHEVADILFN